jgi:pimeloyl-ACP methyl ester carboxylesterase
LPGLHLARVGQGPRLVFVHGSISAGWEAWDAQRTLADRFELLVLWRSGYAPNPPLDALDFDVQADEVVSLLRSGDHLVAHSHGGVVALLAAARAAPMLASLTLVEPAAFALAPDDPDVRAFEDGLRSSLAGVTDPVAYFRTFANGMGAPDEVLPTELPPAFEDRVRTFMLERWPGEAEIDLDAISRTPLPVLVVSGDWHPAFDAVCDVIEERLGAERVVLSGAGHTVQEVGRPFNDALASFVERTEHEMRDDAEASGRR